MSLDSVTPPLKLMVILPLSVAMKVNGVDLSTSCSFSADRLFTITLYSLLDAAYQPSRVSSILMVMVASPSVMAVTLPF